MLSQSNCLVQAIVVYPLTPNTLRTSGILRYPNIQQLVVPVLNIQQLVVQVLNIQQLVVQVLNIQQLVVQVLV